jgi:hypothetical protein
MFRIRRGILVLSVLVVCAGAAELRATTIVPMSDHDLAVSSRAIVEGRVVATESVWDPARRAVFTYVALDVATVYKGALSPGHVVLEQLGGVTDDIATELPGAPRLAAGDRVVAFLNTDRRGVLHVAHLSIGLFRVHSDPKTGVETVVRDSGAAVLELGGAACAATSRAPRDAFLERLRATLAATAGEAATYDERWAGIPILAVPPGFAPSYRPQPSFTLIPPGFRWFEPDSGIAIPYKVNGSTAPTPSKGLDEARAALGAWSHVSSSSLELKYAGRSSGGGRRADGANEIAFGDPLDELDDPVNCTGVIAAGGVTTAAGEATTYAGKPFHRIAEGDVVVNDGFDCLLSNSTVLMEVLTHELGHTVGLGHSSERLDEPAGALKDATMYFAIHDDDRGASLRVDDSQAVRTLYARPASMGPLALLTTDVPNAVPGSRYMAELRARGGTTPYVFEVSSGTLPRGVALAQDGRLAGTPETAGTWPFAVRLRDAGGAELSQSFVLAVTSAPAPYLVRAAYDATSGRLRLYGLYFDAGATVEVNGSTVTGAVRFAPVRGRLSVAAPPARFGLGPAGTNTAVVVVDGRRSNVLAF